MINRKQRINEYNNNIITLLYLKRNFLDFGGCGIISSLCLNFSSEFSRDLTCDDILGSFFAFLIQFSSSFMYLSCFSYCSFHISNLARR